jgi:hypothetical protein
METSKLKKFASFARSVLIEQVGTRLKSVLADQSLARREKAAAVDELEKKIKELGKERVIEMVAYTWFNRFCALRFMDVNQYTTIGSISPAEGFTQPEILTEAKQGVIDEELKVDRAKIIGFLDGTRPSQDAQGEVYQQLLIAVCNSYHKLMPFIFEKIADYTELLLPEDLLSDSSVLAETRKALTVENCADVEVIGWLYQFYISEKKDDVFAALKKGKKITPENIPAATQLFTPHWIVRYLVENSLGRLWMLNRPDSRLVEQMDYYIRPEEPETDFLRIASPEEIKVCDPACGSGHMLTYAFDLLYAIYEEQGYQATDIPRLILKHNLYGVEIDQRAGALAAFALVMKAREKDRRFFSRKPLEEDSSTAIQNPNVCVLENISIDPEDLSAYMDKVGRNLFSDGLQGVVNQWEEADNFGSLIRPLVTDVSEVLELLRERQLGEDLFLAGVHQKVLKALRQADFLSPKYHVVVANPPYMGGKGMNKTLKAFIEGNLKESKSDTFGAFMLRNLELSLCEVAMVTPYVWMFLSSFEKLRESLLRQASLTGLVQLEYNAFEPACVPVCAFTMEKPNRHDLQGQYIRLSEFRGHETQGPKTLEAIRNPDCEYRFRTRQRNLELIPGSPIAYWLSERLLKIYSLPTLDVYANPRQGLATGDNDRFLRLWHEISFGTFTDQCASLEEARERKEKWYPVSKGGGFRRWFGNRYFVIAFDDENYELLLNSGNHLPSRDFYFHAGATWSTITSGPISFRSVNHSIFETKGSVCFSRGQVTKQYLLGSLNSCVTQALLAATSPTLDYHEGPLRRIPFQLLENHEEIEPVVNEMLEISASDWNSYETAWSFYKNPLVEKPMERIGVTYSALRESQIECVFRLKELEEDNNLFFVRGYDLEGELDCNVPLSDLSLHCNPAYRYDSDKSESELEALLLADTMREFISYAVGCMLGRYSLDKPGLILANQGETADDYRQQIPEPSFAPDEDNVIPLLDGDWFEDDITERFKVFLKVTFGTEHYEENLKFLEDALYPDNLTAKKRKTIREYFLKDFYNHHIKLYKKRPIYWLFSSPKGTFNALIYMHRYRPDTVGTVLHYLRDFRDKLTHHADHQQMLADSASASKSEKTQAIKDVAAIKKQLKELEDYEKTLFEVAARKIDIDLDDGVKHNYLLFGSVLRKIPGLDAKEEE